MNTQLLIKIVILLVAISYFTWLVMTYRQYQRFLDDIKPVKTSVVTETPDE